MQLNLLKIGRFSRFLTTLVFVVLMHALLILHLAVCSHKSVAHESYEFVALNISIEPQLAGAGSFLKQEVQSEKIYSMASSSKKLLYNKESNISDNKSGNGDFNILPVNSSPKFLHYQPPAYPAAAKRMKQQGVVVVDVKLDSELGQWPATLYSSSGYNLLDAAAIEAANNSVLQSAFEGVGSASDYAYIARIRYQFQLRRK